MNKANPLDVLLDILQERQLKSTKSVLSYQQVKELKAKCDIFKAEYAMMEEKVYSSYKDWNFFC